MFANPLYVRGGAASGALLSELCLSQLNVMPQTRASKVLSLAFKR